MLARTRVRGFSLFNVFIEGTSLHGMLLLKHLARKCGGRYCHKDAHGAFTHRTCLLKVAQ